jgi:hypothetical protein
MPIPAFTIDGILPPFVGPDGPGGRAEDMSPYAVTAVEVVTTLGSTNERNDILRGWLDHRAALRRIGFDRGFQWIDGSFVESKIPQDLDVLTFFYGPSGITRVDDLKSLLQANIGLFDRHQVKASFHLDFFMIGLNDSVEGIVNATRYYFGVFSHRRGDHLWKGMLHVRLENAGDVRRPRWLLSIRVQPDRSPSVPERIHEQPTPA